MYRSKKSHTKTSVCLTPACVHASSEILYNLSPEYKTIDPCNNFEELVCGGWDEHHDLRPDQGDAFTGTIMSENSQMLLRHILEAPYPGDSKVCTPIAGKGQKLMTSCASTPAFLPCNCFKPSPLSTNRTLTN